MARIKFITMEKLLEMKTNNDDFELVDALPEEEFKKGSIPGAVNISSDNIAAQAEEKLEKNKPIVTYCANYACQASTIAAKKLLELGFENVLDFKAGKEAWENAGFDLEQ